MSCVFFAFIHSFLILLTPSPNQFYQFLMVTEWDPKTEWELEMSLRDKDIGDLQFSSTMYNLP